MERKLKSLLRSSRTGKDSNHDPPRAAATLDPQTPRATQRASELTPPSSGSKTSEQAASSWPNQSTPTTRPMEDSPRSITSSTLADRRASIISNSNSIPSRKPLPTRKDADSNIADDYVAYLPAVEQDMQYMTLGGDKRLIDTASTQHNSEDVADRNIQLFGSDRTSSTYSSVYTANETSHRLPIGRPDSYGQRSPHSVGKDLLDGSSRTVSGHQGVDAAPTIPANIGKTSIDGGMSNGRRRQSNDQAMQRTFSETSEHDQHSPLVKTISHAESSCSGAVKRQGPDGIIDGHAQAPSLEGIVDLTDSVDVDRSVNWAPAVTHEVVKPHEHEILEERIYREIHNHDVYHYIQPVHQIEILPTRHFMPNPANPSDHTDLVEISEDSLPRGTTFHQRWFIAEQPEDPNTPRSKFFTGPRRTEPVVLEDKTYMTPEGFERRETTILHPPTLEDMSGYGGPVLPIHFDKGGAVQEGAVRTLEGESRKVEEALVNTPDPLMVVDPKVVAEKMQEKDEGSPIPQQFVPDRASSKRHRWSRSLDVGEGDRNRNRAVQRVDEKEEERDMRKKKEPREPEGRGAGGDGVVHNVTDPKKLPSMLDV